MHKVVLTSAPRPLWLSLPKESPGVFRTPQFLLFLHFNQIKLEALTIISFHSQFYELIKVMDTQWDVLLDSFLSQYVHLWKPKQVLRSKISLPVLHLHLLLHFRMLLLSAWMETSCSWLLSRRALQRHIAAVLGADNGLCGVFIFHLVMFFFF